MSDTKSPPELSMDEILATIRRIIAEDEQPGGAASGPTGSAGTAGSAATHSATEDAFDDIVELTEALNEDGSVRHLVPMGGTSRIAALREPAAAAVPTEPVSIPPAAPAETKAPEPTGESGQPAAVDERLVAAVASSAAAASLAERAPAPSEQSRELPLGEAHRSLEDIVRDLLRPMLQTWLDQHLPEIVERLAQAEIARGGKSGATLG
jgi:uncharacterized protein